MAQKDGAGQWDQLLSEIKDYVYHYEIEASSPAWGRARACVLDALGCAVLAVNISPDCATLLGPHVRGTTVDPGFRLPGTAFTLDPIKGAFDLATMIRWLDYNDCLSGTDWGHPSDNLGAILAVAGWRAARDAREGAPGSGSGPALTIRTLLVAAIKAYEVQGRFQACNSFNGRGLDHTILVKLASTAVVAWLLGLGEGEALAALSHVFADGCPLRVFRAGSNTTPRKGWAAGDACARAVTLALLAQRGQPGLPTVLTMPRWGFYENIWNRAAGPRGEDAAPAAGFVFPAGEPKFETYVMESVAFKLAPVEGHVLLALDAALQQGERLRARGLAAHADVAAVHVRTCAATIAIADKPGALRNPADRDHSLQYILGLALLKGAPPAVEDYRDESPWASDPRLLALSERFHLAEDPAFTRALKGERRRGYTPVPITGVTLVLRDGTRLDEIVVRDTAGTPMHPGTLEGVERKFRQNMAVAYTKAEVEAIMGLVQKDDLPIVELLDRLAR